jgi:zinc transport system permease protein
MRLGLERSRTTQYNWVMSKTSFLMSAYAIGAKSVAKITESDLRVPSIIPIALPSICYAITLIVNPLFGSKMDPIRFSTRDHPHCITSNFLGALSTLGGLQLAYLYDTPTGPPIVCVAATCFALANFLNQLSGLPT